MKKYALPFLLAAGVLTAVIAGCSKSSEDVLAQQGGGTPACDTTHMTYSVDVKPILEANCYSCHGNGQSQNGVALDTYAEVKAQVDNSNLINVIKHTPGYPAMPDGLPQLSACNINIIQDWINRGAPND